jgi:hypothetical protein
MPQQALDQHAEFVVLGVQFPMLVRRRGHRIAQHLLQQSRVVRQPIEVDFHLTMMVNAVASVPAIFAQISAFSIPPIPVAAAPPVHATHNRRAALPTGMMLMRSARSYWQRAIEIGLAPAASSACKDQYRHARST